ncbi:substrate-binding domain-containing protein [Sporolactobacillus sp. STCC-11]|uniref:substrate-binding domain-containing protein n=1 Tax=Sporolactobacillus caesalpiniae TaxID=3230362 RepID=UPI0033961B79
MHEKGAKSLLVVSRLSDHVKESYGQRKIGFIDYCEEHNLNYKVFDVNCSDVKYTNLLRNYLKEQFGEHTRTDIDGIFAVSEQYAGICCFELRSLGRLIPEQVQIIGFDGSRPYPTQPIIISSLRQPVEELAQSSINMLNALNSGISPDKIQNIILPVKFIQGITTKQ